MSQYGAGLYLQVILLINIPFGDKYNYWSYLAKIFSCKYQKCIPQSKDFMKIFTTLSIIIASIIKEHQNAYFSLGRKNLEES